MVKSYMSFELEAADEVHTHSKHDYVGESHERHYVMLSPRDPSFKSIKASDMSRTVTVAYATPEQVDAHIAALQALRESWPVAAPFMSVEATEAVRDLTAHLVAAG